MSSVLKKIFDHRLCVLTTHENDLLRLHRYFPFLYIQNRIYVFFFFTNAEQKVNYMKRVAILFLSIFNELQLYEMNCNDIRRRKLRCRNVGFNMLNQLSLFYFNIFIKLLLLFVLLKLLKRILFSIQSSLEIFFVYIKLSIFIFLFIRNYIYLI